MNSVGRRRGDDDRGTGERGEAERRPNERAHVTWSSGKSEVASLKTFQPHIPKRLNANVPLEGADIHACTTVAGGEADFLAAALSASHGLTLCERILDCSGNGRDVKVGGRLRRHKETDRTTVRVDVQ